MQVETHRSFVNSWECDENRHMNVQFYWRRFHEASIHAAHEFGLPTIDHSPPVRHVRYHSEGFEGDLLAVTSQWVLDGPYPTTIAHFMANRENGQLVATALDGYATNLKEGHATALKDENAVGRSIGEGYSILQNNAPLNAIGITDRRVVLPRDCGMNGVALHNFIVGAFSDAASHFWEDIGLTKSWLDDNKLGRVAVEKKISTLHPLKPDTAIIIRSALTKIASKTFSFVHLLIGLDGTCYAIGEITGLALSFETRKAIEIPQSRRRLMKEHLFPLTDIIRTTPL